MKEIHKFIYDSTTAISGAGVADVASHHNASNLLIFLAAALAPVARDLIVTLGTWLLEKIKQKLGTKTIAK